MNILAKFLHSRQKTLFFSLFLMFGFIGIALLLPKSAFAQACSDIPGICQSSCSPADGKYEIFNGAALCGGSLKCCKDGPIVQRNSGDGGGITKSDSVFGTVQPPAGVSRFSDNGSEIGLLNFISMLVRIFTVIMGLVTFFNFILSGYTYIMSDGNSKAAETVKNRLTYSVLGLVLIVSSYTIVALISLIIFGDASYILNPTLPGPGTP